MKAKLLIAPAAYPITLAQAKKQAELDDGDTRHDDFMKTLIRTATGDVEQFLHRRLITQTWNYYLNRWPWHDSFELPFGSLQSVTSTIYKDEDGDETTFSSDDYIVDTESEPGRIVLGFNKSWPTDTLFPSNPIKVEFTCGYFIGDTWVTLTAYAENDQVMPVTENGLVYYASTSGTTAATEPTWPLIIGGTVTDGTVVWTCIGISVPDSIRHAIKISISDMFENREENVYLPNHFALKTWESLLLKYKLWGGIIGTQSWRT